MPLKWIRAGKCSAVNCVEMARLDENTILLRDSKTRQTLTFDQAEMSAFIAGVKNGEFD